MTPIVVDASVAVAWFSEEVGSARAQRLQEATEPLLAPSFLLAEVANALLMKTKRQQAPAGHATACVTELRRGGIVSLVDLHALVEPASILAERLTHPIYDCLYLVLAQRESAMLATFDRPLAALATRLSIPLWPAQDPAA